MTIIKLKKLLSYNNSTGIFTWKKKSSKYSNIIKGQLAGSVSSTGYIKIKINNKMYLAHRLAWLYEYGVFPLSQIDHMNHIRSDNRISNLRDVSSLENSQNMRIFQNNKSGVSGVYWCKQTSMWHARISVCKKRIDLGRFVIFSDAVNARQNAESLYKFHKNHGKVL